MPFLILFVFFFFFFFWGGGDYVLILGASCIGRINSFPKSLFLFFFFFVGTVGGISSKRKNVYVWPWVVLF